MPLYFAYGANLDRAAMAQRCPYSTDLGLARLDGHRFIIMSAGYATVVPSAKASVHGLLWNIAAADLSALDAYEEVDSGLYRRAILPVVQGGRRLDAMIYLAQGTVTGVPCPDYMESVLAAAEQCGLPLQYRAELRTWLRRG